MKTTVIIPALNEEQSIARVIAAIPDRAASEVIVVDNGSNDATTQRASEAGARVVMEARRGYGSACLRGIAEVRDAEIIVFLDADFSDDPTRMNDLLEPIRRGEADLVIGSRTLGEREPGALPSHARFGNALACWLIRVCFGERFTDLGPFRAIRREALEQLGMRDRNYGWTVEMQAKAAILGLRCVEVPVPYRRRVGRSKISGTVKGSTLAGMKILWTIFDVWRHGKTVSEVTSSD